MSTIKVNKIEKRSGSTLTLGGACTAVTLACGATQTGFGRTGTVNWCTTAKTSPFTATNGDGFFVNTTGGAVTVTLPSSPSAGDIVAIADYANTFATACKEVTIGRNGSKINGECSNATLDTAGQSVTLVYVDGTRGWKTVTDSTSNVTGIAFVAATGGTETTSGDFKIHTFTSSGCFQVTNGGNATGSNTVSYMVVAGGGGSGRYYGAGGGGGGFREGKTTGDTYTASPLNAPAGLPVTAQTYPITVGAGGATGSGSPPYTNGDDGSASVFSTITSAGGGGGAGGNTSQDPANAGGSGGGGHQPCSGSPQGGEAGGAGNTPPVSPPQGSPGVTVNAPGWAGAGGGATATGVVRVGGAGATSSITGSPVGRAGGGAGGPAAGTPGSPQPGAAAASPCGSGANYNTNAGANTGGGGGSDGGAGGSGVVVIRYKFQ